MLRRAMLWFENNSALTGHFCPPLSTTLMTPGPPVHDKQKREQIDCLISELNRMSRMNLKG